MPMHNTSLAAAESSETSSKDWPDQTRDVSLIYIINLLFVVRLVIDPLLSLMILMQLLEEYQQFMVGGQNSERYKMIQTPKWQMPTVRIPTRHEGSTKRNIHRRRHHHHHHHRYHNQINLKAYESLAPSQIASKSSHARRSSKAHRDVSKVKATGAD